MSASTSSNREKTLSVRLEPELKERLRARAKAEHRTSSSLAAHWICAALKRAEAEEGKDAA